LAKQCNENKIWKGPFPFKMAVDGVEEMDFLFLQKIVEGPNWEK